MNITEIRIRLMRNPKGGVMAAAAVVIDDALAVHDILGIEEEGRQFLAMPSRRCPDGLHRDMVHPIDAESRRELTQAVLSAYRQERRRSRAVS